MSKKKFDRESICDVCLRKCTETYINLYHNKSGHKRCMIKLGDDSESKENKPYPVISPQLQDGDFTNKQLELILKTGQISLSNLSQSKANELMAFMSRRDGEKTEPKLESYIDPNRVMPDRITIGVDEAKGLGKTGYRAEVLAEKARKMRKEIAQLIFDYFSKKQEEGVLVDTKFPEGYDISVDSKAGSGKLVITMERKDER